jgi:hypothetical protein
MLRRAARRCFSVVRRRPLRRFGAARLAADRLTAFFARRLRQPFLAAFECPSGCPLHSAAALLRRLARRRFGAVLLRAARRGDLVLVLRRLAARIIFAVARCCASVRGFLRPLRLFLAAIGDPSAVFCLVPRLPFPGVVAATLDRSFARLELDVKRLRLADGLVVPAAVWSGP